MDEPRIAIAASPREWAQALHRHVADHGGARVRATVLHQQDAIAEDYDVFVGDDSTSFLTRRLVDELHRRGRCVLGVYDPDDPRGKGELVDMEVDDVIARDADPAAFVAAITALRARERPVDTEFGALVREVPLDGSGTAALTDGIDGRSTRHAAPAAGTDPAEVPSAGGRLVAVGGTSGGTGATEVAIGLAHALARRGEPAILVDVDDLAPSIAQRLGLPLYPNVRAAVDAIEHRRQPLEDTLAPLPAGGFRVLPGLATGRSWQDLQPTAGLDVLRSLAADATVVANIGHIVEDLHGSGGLTRYGVTRAVLGTADVIVAVAQPSPVGLARLLEWLGDLRVLTAVEAVHVVFARAPGSDFKRGELAEELTRSVAPAGIWFVPEDARVGTAAWAGALTANGPFTRAVMALADGALPGGRAARGRRGRRRRATA